MNKLAVGLIKGRPSQSAGQNKPSAALTENCKSTLQLFTRTQTKVSRAAVRMFMLLAQHRYIHIYLL
jgi:hypothetical protein